MNDAYMDGFINTFADYAVKYAASKSTVATYGGSSETPAKDTKTLASVANEGGGTAPKGEAVTQSAKPPNPGLTKLIPAVAKIKTNIFQKK